MDDDDVRARDRDERVALFALADDIITARFDVFPAAVWTRDDGTVAKAPLLRNGHLGAHRDRQLIRQQLIDPPHRPPSVPDVFEVVVAFVPGSGGCGVLDCDVKHGKAGQAAINALRAEHGEFAKAAWRSPSGGVNILFHKPPGVTYSNWSPWPGIDVRADNGWVVAPGNVCSAGAWTWRPNNNFTTAVPLPEAMTYELRTADTHGPIASNAETRAFIEASPESSSYDAQRTFGVKLAAFRQATEGSRHGALLDILSWCGGMHALDLRWAIEQVKQAWHDLTDGEGREDEVGDVFTWVVGQELRTRAALVPAASIDVYQPSDFEDIAVDWRAFAQRDTAPRDWLVEGLWPNGRAVALWANAKEGKSELALWCMARLAMGLHPWWDRQVPPVHVAYFDFEMTEDDLEERLDLFGFDVDDLHNLHYALFPPLHPLDVEAGGAELLAWVQRWGAQAVVIDTFTAAVEGDENNADTVRAFTRHTGLRLKQHGIPYLRTDHAGKDRGRGPRGTSAKQQDVDVTWSLTRTRDGVSLSCANGSRLSWVGPKLDVQREVEPKDGTVSYTMPPQIATVPQGTLDKMRELDAASVPLDAGRPAAIAALKAAGVKPGKNAVISAALKARRERAQRAGTGAGDSANRTAPGQVPGTGADERGQSVPDLFSPGGTHGDS